ncbi:uncharacterized protein Dwil_GK26999 [Drosophila willistoni]|uniref:Uncharacterized protein n=1 Tax=Drosophila willistoni TaxID=7260 RepID=A0A0Q9WZ93_DROWI|nr:uncharacterized protein Dwil_GK26999 [Drosophila willistoni]
MVAKASRNYCCCCCTAIAATARALKSATTIRINCSEKTATRPRRRSKTKVSNLAESENTELKTQVKANSSKQPAASTQSAKCADDANDYVAATIVPYLLRLGLQHVQQQATFMATPMLTNRLPIMNGMNVYVSLCVGILRARI